MSTHQTALMPPSPEPDPQGLDLLLGAVGRTRSSDQNVIARLMASVVCSQSDPDLADLEVLAAGVSITEELADRIRRAWVRALVRRLPAPHHHVIHWRYGLDGPRLTVRQTAMCMGIGVATVHRAAGPGGGAPAPADGRPVGAGRAGRREAPA